MRRDIRDADAEQLEETLNRDLVVPFVLLNFGPQEIYPRLTLKEPDAEDLTLLVTALEKLVPLGLEVEQSVIRDKLGLPDPDEGAKLLTASPSPMAPAMNAERHANAEGATFTPEQQALEDLADRAVETVAAGMAANEAVLLQIIIESQSKDKARPQSDGRENLSCGPSCLEYLVPAQWF